MTVLTVEHVARYALGAGWSAVNGDAIVATAVAMAESGGDTNAHATKGEDSRGLWQMNVAAHPNLAGLNLYDPAVNAKAAHDLWQAQGWGPWSTHNNGQYLLFMALAGPAVAAAKVAGPLGLNAANDAFEIQANTTADAIKGGIQTGQVLGGFLSDLENPDIWIRTGKVIIGAILIIAGMVLLVRPVVQPIVDSATSGGGGGGGKGTGKGKGTETGKGKAAAAGKGAAAGKAADAGKAATASKAATAGKVATAGEAATVAAV